jgi:hypothetical protein
MELQHLTLNVAITPEQTFTYVNVPFKVPQGIGQIEVSYTYPSAISSDPHVSGGNTIDIGLIDPRGAEFMTQGFRGWSGSARHTFYVGEDSATPGYLAGPIQAGTWHVCLGVYKVAADGCACEVEITLTHSARTTGPDFPARLPVQTTSRRERNPDDWYRGELHCHTVHSDGDSTVEEVIQIAEGLGLDFLAITDHNNRSQLAELAKVNTVLVLIPGYEVTTYYGHWNIWGDGAWIDFRVQSPDDLRKAIQTAQREGYLVSCNHPRTMGLDWAFPEVEGFSCVEVWNGPWWVLNEMCLAFWEARLKQGQRLVAVGGSDFHFSKREHDAHLAQPTMFIHCPEIPSAANLLKHLRLGHAFVTASSTGPRLDWRAGEARMGDSIVAAQTEFTLTVEGARNMLAQICTAQGIVARLPVSEDLQTFAVIVDGTITPYARAQIVDPATGYMMVIGNPIYFGSSR